MANRSTSRAIVLALFSVGVVGIGSLALTLKTFPERLQAPFGLIAPQSEKAAAGQFQGSPELASNLLTDTKDTDRDGIPDVQELQIYSTSPFLEDSDSDGILDKTEIDQGTNPNCPEGVDCRSVFESLPSARDAQKEEFTQSLYDASIISKLEQTGIPGFSDAASIRGFLLQAGVPEEILAQFDDAALLNVYQESAQGAPPLNPPLQEGGEDRGSFPRTGEETKLDSPPLAGGVSGGGVQSAEVLPESPTPEEIRALLLKGGANRALVDAFGNEQLVELYQEVLGGFEGR